MATAGSSFAGACEQWALLTYKPKWMVFHGTTIKLSKEEG
eukprot:SAG22_NODE_20621_length_264_cov_0.624242_1_plen_39_part_01